MQLCKKSKNYKKLRQSSMKNYFIAKNSAKKGIYCEDCRRKFQSLYHLNYHLSSAMPCRDSREGPSIDEPHTLIQHMPEEILYLICDFFLFKDLVNFICALPRLLVCHGMKTLWSQRMNRQHPRFNPSKMHVSMCWLIANETKLLEIESFINIYMQGNNSRDYDDMEEYHNAIYRLYWNGIPCRRARIWNLNQYARKYNNAMWRRGPLDRWILF
jgi:hypothetical protein